MMIDCAKMIGITPAVLTRSGMCVLRPAVDLAADDPPGVLDRDPALPLRDQHDQQRPPRS